jgi:hypothetical protein
MDDVHKRRWLDSPSFPDNGQLWEVEEGESNDVEVSTE